MNKALLPCKSCPWRLDQCAQDIPRYNQEKAEKLLETVGPEDGFRSIMACHMSTDEKMRACNGYLAVHGYGNLNVRLLLLKKEINNPAEVQEACKEAGIELHQDYPAVLEKLRGNVEQASEKEDEYGK